MLVSSLALASEDVAVRFYLPYLNCYANPFTFKAMASYFTMGPNSLIFTYFQYSQGKLCKRFHLSNTLKCSEKHFIDQHSKKMLNMYIFKKDLASKCHGSYRNPFTKERKSRAMFSFHFFFVTFFSFHIFCQILYHRKWNTSAVTMSTFQMSWIYR